MNASQIRWRPPRFGQCEHEFRVGNQVVIARTSPQKLTDPEIIGHYGYITEVDDTSDSLVEVYCYVCRSTHSMHEDELDLMESELVRMAREKGNVPDDVLLAGEEQKRELEDRIAIAVHEAGFLRVAVEDRPVPFGEPNMRRPIWSKYVYGTIWTMAPFKLFGQALVEAARAVDGCLVEWCYYNARNGWQVLSCDDMETLTLEMPIRASFQSSATREDTPYDDAKVLAERWLEDKHKIDKAGVGRAIMALGFTVEEIEKGTGDTLRCAVQDTKDRDSISVLVAWAEKNWNWGYGATISVKDSKGKYFDDIDCVSIRWAGGELVVEAEADVPF